MSNGTVIQSHEVSKPPITTTGRRMSGTGTKSPQELIRAVQNAHSGHISSRDTSGHLGDSSGQSGTARWRLGHLVCLDIRYVNIGAPILASESDIHEVLTI